MYKLFVTLSSIVLVQTGLFAADFMQIPPPESLKETGTSGVYFDQFNINKDVIDLPGDSAKVRQARQNVRNARHSFELARAENGWDHPQSQSAIDSLQKAEIALHHELGDTNQTPDWGVAQTP